MITKSIIRCIHTAIAKGWEKTYWAIDIHGTIMIPNYKVGEITKEYYPWAKEVLQLLSIRKDVVLLLYTCSYPHEIEEYLSLFCQDGIQFQYVNENPEVTDGGYGHYKNKFYFNILLEDKAGFDPHTDWESIHTFLKNS